MSYQRAQGLKGVGLGRLIVNRTVNGEGFGRSIKSAISDKVVAKMTRIKEKFDPMNIAKMFGGRLGAYAMGKMTGRSEEDMAHFTGSYRRGRNATHQVNSKKNPMITKIAEGNTQKMKKGDGLADVLSKIYNLIKQDSLLKLQHEEILKNEKLDPKSKEEQRQKWHEELIKALGGKSTLGKTATLEKSPNILDMIRNAIDKMFGGIKDIIQFFSELRVAGLFKNLVSVLRTVGIILASPIGLSLIGFATAGYAAWKFLDYIKENTPDTTVLTPDQAQATLEGGVTKQIDAAGGRAKLENIIKTGQKQAKIIEAMPEGADKEAARKKAGGTSQVQATAADTKVYEVPTYNEANDRVTPKPKRTTGFRGVNDTKLWEDKYGKDYNDDGTRKKLAPISESAPTTPTTPQVVPKTASETPSQASPVTQQMQSEVKTNNNMKLDESISPKIITIDNSKTNNMGGGSSGSSISNDSSIPVRIDDSTLQNIFKKNLRMV